MKKTLLLIILLMSVSMAHAADYAWQEHQAEVTETGDIKWSPRPFAFKAGANIRYIDYENGDDNKDGATKTTAWKHHPWDRFAEGKAAAHEGVTTYVFKGGVDYRGILVADESGKAGDPIRLTRDPEWGEGPARILGSYILPPKWVKATQVNCPARMPDKDKVWAMDLNALGIFNEKQKGAVLIHKATYDRTIDEPWYGLFRVEEDDSSHVQHLARTPNWQPGNENFPLDYWHTMDDRYEVKNPDNPDQTLRTGFTDEWLKGHPTDYFEGGYIWPQYALFMGGPTARLIEKEMEKKGHTFPVYDPEKGYMLPNKFGSWGKNLRYMIDNLPQFLDAPEEFYLDKNTGLLFYRPLEGTDPNKQRLEWSMIDMGIYIEAFSHIYISGLDFRYQNAGVYLEPDMKDVLISNCTFEDIRQYGIAFKFQNWRGDRTDDPLVFKRREADEIRIHDCYFQDIWETAVTLSAASQAGKFYNRHFKNIEVLRNKSYNTGIRHQDNIQTPLPAFEIMYPETGIIAGNYVEDSWGSGLMIFAGETSGNSADFPLSRLLVYENKTIDTALAVNDYGGMSLWQGGSIYCYNNNIGNSPGVMPAGILMFSANGKPTNLSYPLYLDGAYKVFSFNNIIWARSNDPKEDEYATKTPGYFMVFGFLNQFFGNTLYRTGKGVGGSAGNRNDVVGNLMVEVGDSSRLNGRNPDAFIAHDRAGDPSLVGGGDDGSSGRTGVPTLAYANNVFHGEGLAGKLLSKNPEGGYPVGIEGKTVEELAEAMKTYPIRYAQLGWRSDEKPIPGKSSPEPIKTLDEVDFTPKENSMAVDKGATYFVPWSLYGTVGEWHFTENHADPNRCIDYAWYQSYSHANRMFYPYVPGLDLQFNTLTLDDGYSEGALEDWCRGAVTFDGKRFATVNDAKMREDINVPVYFLGRDGELRKKKRLIDPETAPKWTVPEPIKGKGRRAEYEKDAKMVFPGEERKTLIFRTENLLVEAVLRTSTPNGGILGKFDGKSGYRLYLNPQGKAVFEVASGGKTASVESAEAVNNGEWRHVLAEIDRASGAMRIYVDGKLSNEAKAGLAANASLENNDDFLVGKTHDGVFFTGQIDFMRVCQGTLADARTSIEELYAWQTDGPFKYDMRGRKPVGRRDAGALEYVK